MIHYHISLPFPVSVNRIWRATSAIRTTRAGTQLGTRVIVLSPQYRAWIAEADALWLTQKRKFMPLQTLTWYVSDMIFDERRWVHHLRDGENLMKGVSDWLQRAGIIHNDALAKGGTWCWGRSEGCDVTVSGVSNAAALTVPPPLRHTDRRRQPVRQPRAEGQ